MTHFERIRANGKTLHVQVLRETDDWLLCRRVNPKTVESIGDSIDADGNVTDVQHAIDKSAITKRTRMVEDRMFGHLVRAS